MRGEETLNLTPVALSLADKGARTVAVERGDVGVAQRVLVSQAFGVGAGLLLGGHHLGLTSHWRHHFKDEHTPPAFGHPL